MTYLVAMIISALGAMPKLKTSVLWALVVVMSIFAIRDHSQEWGVYHYFIGSKYFEELGYFELYECTIDAPIVRRDLRTYDYRFDAPDCRAQFTPERWAEFRADVVATGFYPASMRDKGANMTPFWIVLSETVIRAGASLDSLLWLDYVALIVAVMLIGRMLGWRVAAYVALWIVAYYGTIDRLIGHYAQWLWLASTLVGVAMLKTRRDGGAILIAVASLLAIFPAFLMLFYIKNKRAMMYFIVAGMVGAVIGLGNSRGIDGYFEFVENMQIHSAYTKAELCCNVGLAHGLNALFNDPSAYLACFNGSGDCQTSYESDYPHWLVFALIPPLLLSPFGVMFGVQALSVYYFNILAVMAIYYDERWIRYALAVNALIIAVYFVAGASGRIYAQSILLYLFFVVMGMRLTLWKSAV